MKQQYIKRILELLQSISGDRDGEAFCNWNRDKLLKYIQKKNKLHFGMNLYIKQQFPVSDLLYAIEDADIDLNIKQMYQNRVNSHTGC